MREEVMPLHLEPARTRSITASRGKLRERRTALPWCVASILLDLFDAAAVAASLSPMLRLEDVQVDTIIDGTPARAPGSILLIKHFSDHAANERTFLAWIRTAIAVEAFGFLVEKFDVFLQVASHTGGVKSPSLIGETISDVVGLLLLLLGGLIVVLATLRFRRLAAAIDSPDEQAPYGARIDYMVVGMLVVFGGVLFTYMSYSVLHGR